MYTSLYGCPHRCGFCYKSSTKLWRGKSAKRVLDEIEYIIKKPQIKIIDPIDDNVFVDEYRVKEICQGLIDRKLVFNGGVTCASTTWLTR